MASFTSTKKKFICSGDVTSHELNDYKQMINQLGGRFWECNSEHFINSCTHVICFSFSTTVKIMGGLATGKWLVTKEYVVDSSKIGYWLNEEPYEVIKNDEIAKFQRLKNTNIYDKYNIYLELGQEFRTKCFRRVLMAGGAFAMNKEDVKQDPTKVLATICDKTSLELVKKSVLPNTPILKVDYIKETLFFKHDPKDFNKYLWETIAKISSPGSIKMDAAKRSEVNCSPSKRRIRNRATTNKIPFTKEKYHDIKSYFVPKISGHSSNRSFANEKFGSSDSPSTSMQTPVKSVYLENTDDCRGRSHVIDLQSQPDCIENEAANKCKKNIITVGEKGREQEVKHGASKADHETMPSLLNDFEGNTNLDHKIHISQSKDLREKTSECMVKIPLNTNETASGCQSEIDVTKPNSAEDQASSNQLPLSTFELNKSRLRKSTPTLIINNGMLSYFMSQYVEELDKSFQYLSLHHIPHPNFPKPEDKGVCELDISESLIGGVMEENCAIGTKKVGYHTIKVVEVNSQADGDEDYVDSMAILELFQMKIHPQFFPNSQSVGTMIRNYIMKSSFPLVSDKAITIFASLVHLHPPSNTRMRDFYVRVFRDTFFDPEVSHSKFKVWQFLKVVVGDLMSASSEHRHSRVVFMKLLVELLEMDLASFNESRVFLPSLLSYRVFWAGMQQNPSVMNREVKELIQCWLLSVQSNELVSQIITKLVCIMLELMWKWGNIFNPFLLADWPMISQLMPIAIEMFNQFKGIKDEREKTLLKVSTNVAVPWQRLFLVTIAFRTLSSQNESYAMTLPKLKGDLVNEIISCGSTEDVTSHAFRVELLIVLLTSYVEGTGVGYCKQSLLRQMFLSLKKRDALHDHKASSNSGSVFQPSQDKNKSLHKRRKIDSLGNSENGNKTVKSSDCSGVSDTGRRSCKKFEEANKDRRNSMDYSDEGIDLMERNCDKLSSAEGSVRNRNRSSESARRNTKKRGKSDNEDSYSNINDISLSLDCSMLADKITVAFRHLGPYRKEFDVLKSHCSHINLSHFNKVL